MSICFQRGSSLGLDDLNIIVRDEFGAPTNAHSVTYSVFDSTTGTPILVGLADRIPANPSTGVYYAAFSIPSDANVGEWEIHYTVQDTALSQPRIVVMKFGVVSPGTVTFGFAATLSDYTQSLMIRLRYLLRDNNPDRNYHFRPPNRERVIAGYTERIGFIWEDVELFQFIVQALYSVNTSAPRTFFTLPEAPISGGPAIQLPPEWSSVVLDGAASYAVGALALNWIADEFDYSISGVSLNLEKSSKYESMKSNFQERFNTELENAKRTVKIAKGLSQRRYGTGGIFHLGPFSRQGVINIRNFL